MSLCQLMQSNKTAIPVKVLKQTVCVDIQTCNQNGCITNTDTVWLPHAKQLYLYFNPFPLANCICCRQMFLNIVAKGELAHIEQFLLLHKPNCHIYRDFLIFAWMFSKLSAADLLYIGQDQLLTKYNM